MISFVFFLLLWTKRLICFSSINCTSISKPFFFFFVDKLLLYLSFACEESQDTSTIFGKGTLQEENQPIISLRNTEIYITGYRVLNLSDKQQLHRTSPWAHLIDHTFWDWSKLQKEKTRVFAQYRYRTLFTTWANSFANKEVYNENGKINK